MFRHDLRYILMRSNASTFCAGWTHALRFGYHGKKDSLGGRRHGRLAGRSPAAQRAAHVDRPDGRLLLVLAVFGTVFLGWNLLATVLYWVLPLRLSRRLGQRAIMRGFRALLGLMRVAGLARFDLSALDALRERGRPGDRAEPPDLARRAARHLAPAAGRVHHQSVGVGQPGLRRRGAAGRLHPQRCAVPPGGPGGGGACGRAISC